MNPDELLMQIYNDMLDVMASGRPTGSTERLANELRAYLGQPEWPTLETSVDLPSEPFNASGPATPLWRNDRCHYEGCIYPPVDGIGCQIHTLKTKTEHAWYGGEVDHDLVRDVVELKKEGKL